MKKNKQSIPKIGLKADYNYFDWKKDLGFNVLEIGLKDKNIGFNIKKILEAKEILKDKELSMHSQTSRLFSCNNRGVPEFNIAEVNILKSELIICSILGAKELIFHIKNERIEDNEAKILKDLFRFAKKKGIEMIYESSNFFLGEPCIDILTRFPKLGYNLDLGHLNTAVVSKTLGMPLEEFLSKIRKRVIYIHAHNNDGLEDQHRGIDNGNLDWRRILDSLDINKIRKIIMEVRTFEDAASTKRLLEEYLINRTIKKE